VEAKNEQPEYFIFTAEITVYCFILTYQILGKLSISQCNYAVIHPGICILVPKGSTAAPANRFEISFSFSYFFNIFFLFV